MRTRLLVSSLYRQEESAPTITLSPDQSHYLTQVLRHRVGAPVQLFDGRGNHADTQIVLAHKRACQVDWPSSVFEQPRPTPQIHLIQGLARSDRMDWIIEKATELGVASVTPVFTEHSAVKLSEQRALQKRAHWQKVSLAACMQCGQDYLPEINMPVSWQDALATMSASELSFVLDPDAPQSLADTVALSKPDATVTGEMSRPAIHLLIGPESGLSTHEVSLASEHHAVAVRLGPRILRTETAALAAITVVQTMVGDLGA